MKGCMYLIHQGNVMYKSKSKIISYYPPIRGLNNKTPDMLIEDEQAVELQCSLVDGRIGFPYKYVDTNVKDVADVYSEANFIYVLTNGGTLIKYTSVLGFVQSLFTGYDPKVDGTLNRTKLLKWDNGFIVQINARIWWLDFKSNTVKDVAAGVREGQFEKLSILPPPEQPTDFFQVEEFGYCVDGVQIDPASGSDVSWRLYQFDGQNWKYIMEVATSKPLFPSFKFFTHKRDSDYFLMLQYSDGLHFSKVYPKTKVIVPIFTLHDASVGALSEATVFPSDALDVIVVLCGFGYTSYYCTASGSIAFDTGKIHSGGTKVELDTDPYFNVKDCSVGGYSAIDTVGDYSTYTPDDRAAVVYMHVTVAEITSRGFVEYATPIEPSFHLAVAETKLFPKGIISGGRTGNNGNRYLTACYENVNNTITKAKYSLPVGLAAHGMMIKDNHLYVYGGETSQGIKNLDTWRYNLIEDETTLVYSDIVLQNGRLVLSIGDELRFSAIGDPTDFDTSKIGDDKAKFIEVGYKDGSRILQTAVMYGSIIVFKENGNIYRLLGTFPDWTVSLVARTSDISSNTLNAMGSLLFGTKSGLKVLSPTQNYGDIGLSDFQETVKTNNVSNLSFIMENNSIMISSADHDLIYDIASKIFYSSPLTNARQGFSTGNIFYRQYFSTLQKAEGNADLKIKFKRYQADKIIQIKSIIIRFKNAADGDLADLEFEGVTVRIDLHANQSVYRVSRTLETNTFQPTLTVKGNANLLFESLSIEYNLIGE